jgi:hypothetical protein
MYGLVPFGKGFYFPTKCKNNSLGKKNSWDHSFRLANHTIFFEVVGEKPTI